MAENQNDKRNQPSGSRSINAETNKETESQFQKEGRKNNHDPEGKMSEEEEGNEKKSNSDINADSKNRVIGKQNTLTKGM